MAWSATYYLTTTDVTSFGPGGATWDKLMDTSAGSGTVYAEWSNTETNYSYTAAPGAVEDLDTASFNVDASGTDVSAGDIHLTPKLHRFNSSGVSQANVSSVEGEQTCATYPVEWTFTGLSSGLGTWAAGDRLGIEWFMRETGSFSSNCNFVCGASNTWIDLTWISPAQEVDPTGIASGLAFGTAQVDMEVSPTGIASTAAFGTAQANLEVSPTGIASTLAFGTATVGLEVSPTGIASTATVGGAYYVGHTALYPDVYANKPLFEDSGWADAGIEGLSMLARTISSGWTSYTYDPLETLRYSFTTDGPWPSEPPGWPDTRGYLIELIDGAANSAHFDPQVQLCRVDVLGNVVDETTLDSMTLTDGNVFRRQVTFTTEWAPGDRLLLRFQNQNTDAVNFWSFRIDWPSFKVITPWNGEATVHPKGITVADSFALSNNFATLSGGRGVQIDGLASFDMTLRGTDGNPGLLSVGSSATIYQAYPVGAVDQNGVYRVDIRTSPGQPSGVGVRVRLQRANSSGTTQATGTWTSYETTAFGTQDLRFDFTETGLGTFGAGDILVLAVQTDSGGSLYLELNYGLTRLSTAITGATFGTATLNQNVTDVGGIASTLAFGTLQVNLNVYPSGIGSTLAFGTANVGAQYIYPIGIASTSGVGSPQLARLAAMALLHSTLSTSHGCRTAEYKHLGYLTNGWDKVLRWDGRSSSIEVAGIPGPSTEIDSWLPPTVESAGDGTAGLHLIRYRYLDSKTGYPSDPSEEREITISAGASYGKLTLPVGNALSQVGPDAGTGFDFAATTITRNDAGSWVSGGWKVGDYVTVASANTAGNNGTVGPVTAVSASVLTVASASWSVDTGDNTATFNNVAARRIVPSTDSKVDRIVIEMSPVNDATFYTALEIENTANTVAEISISDPELEVSFLPYPDTGHLPPPVAKNIVSHRDRIWLFGQVVHTTGTCNVTNGSVDVGAGSTSPDWRATALGDTVAGSYEKSVAWFFQRAGDDRVYEIDTYDAGNNKLILKDAAGYQGITGTNVEYTVFSRANVIWVSEAGFPESFSPLKFLNGPNGERAGDITAGIGYFSSMLFYAESSMIKVAWDQGPLTDPQLFTISTLYGALSQRVVVEVDGVVYSMDKRGWTSWKGVFPQLISRPIDEIRSLIDYDQAEYFHACYFPELRAIRWFVSYTGDTYPRNYVQFDVDTQTWSTGEYHQAIADSRLVPSDEGLRVMYGDDQGHVWLADRDTADGCDPSVSRLASDAGATTTVIPITGASLPTAGSALTGCYLYHLASGEARLITSNTSSEITVGTAFSNPPTTGDVLWVGAIPSKLRTKAFRARSLGKKSKPREVWIEFTPLASTRYLQMRVYDNLSATAKTWSTGTRNNPDGTVFPGNNTQYPSSDWLIDLSESDGHVEVDIGSEFRRTFEIEFEINEPDAPLELVSLEFVGIELEDEQ